MKTVCKYIAFSHNSGECILGDQCKCAGFQKWLSEGSEGLPAPAPEPERAEASNSFYKKLYNDLTEKAGGYCLISGRAHIVKKDGYWGFSQIDDNSFISVVGCFPDDLIINALSVDFECAVDREGVYDFRALLSHSPAQTGNYPPPNEEVPRYMMIEHIEYKLICDFEVPPPSPSSTPTASGTEGEEYGMALQVTIKEELGAGLPERNIVVYFDDHFIWDQETIDDAKRRLADFYDTSPDRIKVAQTEKEYLSSAPSSANSFDESTCLAAEKKLVAHWKGKAEGKEKTEALEELLKSDPTVGELVEKSLALGVVPIISYQDISQEPPADMLDVAQQIAGELTMRFSEMIGATEEAGYAYHYGAKDGALAMWRKLQSEWEKEPLNVLLANALRRLSEDQMTSLADALYERTSAGSGVRARISEQSKEIASLTAERNDYRAMLERIVGAGHAARGSVLNLMSKYPQIKQA